MAENTVEFDDVEVVTSTDDALLCLIDGEEYWIPKSQISNENDVMEKGDKGTLVIPEWLAKKKGLI